MEIGPGPGALTDLLRPMPWQRLVLLEKDDHFAARHAVQARPGLEVLAMDALRFAWEDLEGAWKIVGNLPYNVASPLMWDIVSRVPCLERAVFMIQKEVADRILAAPGSKTYGGLSVWIQSHARVAKGFKVPPGAFRPPPRVDSAVIVLEQLPPDLRPARPDLLAALIKRCFSRRRKQLHSILRQAYPASYSPALLERMAVAPSMRPEELSPALFQTLALALNTNNDTAASY